jgi:hypothetical protein
MSEFEKFRRTVLRDWESDRSPACATAAEVVFAAVITHAGARGTIVATCPDQVACRSVLHYLASFFQDQQQLSGMSVRHGADRVDIGNVRALVLPRDTSRRPRNVIAKVEMATEGAAPTELKSDVEIVRTLAHILLLAAHRELQRKPDDTTITKDDKIALDIVKAILPNEAHDPQAYLRAVAENRKADNRDDEKWRAWKAVQGGIHRGSSLEGIVDHAKVAPSGVKLAPNEHGVYATPKPVGPDGYYTPAYEAANRERKESGGYQQRQQRAITGGNEASAEVYRSSFLASKML